MSFEKLGQQVRDRLNKKYWIEGELLLAKGVRLYVPMGSLRRELLRKTHDMKWVSHPGEERTMALQDRSYYWPKIGNGIQAYVRSCLVCQLDMMERKKPTGLLQPHPILEKP